jgi:hypothetical protein
MVVRPGLTLSLVEELRATVVDRYAKASALFNSFVPPDNCNPDRIPDLERAKARITTYHEMTLFFSTLLARAQANLELLIHAVQKHDDVPEAVKIAARAAKQECEKINSELLTEMLEDPIKAAAVERRMDHFKEELLLDD